LANTQNDQIGEVKIEQVVYDYTVAPTAADEDYYMTPMSLLQSAVEPVDPATFPNITRTHGNMVLTGTLAKDSADVDLLAIAGISPDYGTDAARCYYICCGAGYTTVAATAAQLSVDIIDLQGGGTTRSCLNSGNFTEAGGDAGVTVEVLYERTAAGISGAPVTFLGDPTPTNNEWACVVLRWTVTAGLSNAAPVGQIAQIDNNSGAVTSVAGYIVELAGVNPVYYITQ